MNVVVNKLIKIDRSGKYRHGLEANMMLDPAFQYISHTGDRRGVLVFCEQGAHRSAMMCCMLLAGASAESPDNVGAYLRVWEE